MAKTAIGSKSCQLRLAATVLGKQKRKNQNKPKQNSKYKIATELQSKNKYLCSSNELCFNHISFSDFRNGNNAMQRRTYLR